MTDWLGRNKKYVKDLKEVLVSFDPKRMREFVETHKEMYDKRSMNYVRNNDDKWLLGTMAKMIMARTDIGEEYKTRAREILDGMGWDYEIN